MQVNVSNLLVGTGTSDKAFSYVLQEYTAYCNVLGKIIN